ncbi:hypothetical protein COU00_00885 [Candidatus Falkowbacteria bacterium CG10_big_fil_rev_8_21_14_0_10_43_11]|uniref:Uncharacterized protein n=1 Tax=Candidatus Falkowbacteria bacterium CG10_big_fil_rev_8_21_14_0_10_43_11 TaxID=1974568 RepID=A0A2M6WMU9_9BACT|nr:MAG: hypothetical protein COU00_00885 [Candidatus Falkowbacteria bacterium CG10_big_fil_rev_8_21_14_0_10_43_11]
MKLTINKNQLQEQPANFLRRAGYAYIHDRHSGRDSFARRLTRDFYPRFHCYVFEQGGQITFNLHLDQRQTRYAGQTAHAGEYDGPLVQEELDRLQAMAEQQISKDETFAEITKERPKKKSWWPF